MTCCDVKPGMLRQRIAIRQRTLTAGARGTYTETTKDHHMAAYVRPVSGTERYEAMRVKPGDRYNVIVRFRGDANGNPFFTIDDRVIYQTREWAVEAVEDIDMAGKWLRLRCLENKPT